jgi:hypothetical protein
MSQLVCLFAFVVSGVGLDPDEEIARLTREFRAARDTKAKLRLVEQLGTKGPAAARVLCEAMTDRDGTVATTALLALESADPELYKPLSEFLLDRDASRRATAAERLADLGEKTRPASPILLARLRSAAAPRGERTEAHWLLRVFAAMRTDDPEVVKYLKGLASAPGTGDLRGGVVQALAAWAGTDAVRRKEMIPALRVALADERSVIIAAEIAGSYGALAKDLLPILTRLKLSPDANTRKAATRAIERITRP